MATTYYHQRGQFRLVFAPDPHLFRLEDLCTNKQQLYYKLAKGLPWDKIEVLYNKCLSNQKRGTINKPARAIIGALLVKHFEVLSDERTIEFIMQNPYAQYLCGLEYYAESPLFSPELFVTLRKRLGLDIINSISKIIYDMVRDAQLKLAIQRAEKERAEAEAKGVLNQVVIEEPKIENSVKIDATCHDAEMRYPVDINILEDVSKHFDKCLEWATSGESKPETKRKETRKAYLQYIKVKRHSKEERASLIKLQISNIEHDFQILLSAIGKLDVAIVRKMPKRLSIPLLASIDVLKQQKYMVENDVHSCPDRICSIYQPHVRCIPRGKAGSRYEYGAKVGISVCNGIVFVDHLSWKAYHEASDLPEQMELYKERNGKYPDEAFCDKIYMTKDNIEKMAEMHVECKCPRLGRKKKSDDTPTEEEQHVASGRRNEVEGKFGTSKRRYDSNEVRAKLPETAEAWIGLSYLAQNAKQLYRYLA